MRAGPIPIPGWALIFLSYFAALASNIPAAGYERLAQHAEEQTRRFQLAKWVRWPRS